MPTTDRDRFDDVPRSGGRVGAHRAENPGTSGWVVLLWSAVAALILIAGGIFGAMIVMGKIALGPEPSASAPPRVPSASPSMDTSYGVLVLNATGVQDLAASMRDTLISAGWAADAVLAGEADAQDFPETTVYYRSKADLQAAQALAGLVGGARVMQSDAYANDFAAGRKQMTVVIGLDRVPADQPEPEGIPQEPESVPQGPEDIPQDSESIPQEPEGTSEDAPTDETDDSVSE